MKNFIFLLLTLTASLGLAVDVKISQLPLGSAASTGSNDSFPYVAAATNVTKRLTIYDLINVPAIRATYAPIASPTFTGVVTSPSFVGPLTGTASGNTTITAANHGVVLSGAANAMTALTPSSSTAFPLVSGGASANPSWALLGVAGGGTGIASGTQYGIPYFSTTTLMASTAAGTSVQVLHGNAAGSPTWSAVSLTADVTGTLPIANGGTNSTATATAGGVGYGTGTAHAYTSAGSTGQILQSATASAPTWSTATYPSTATGTGTYLRADGTNWVASTLTLPNTTTANQILYSSSTSVVGQITTAATSALVTNSSSVPAFTSGSTANRVLRTDGTTVSFAQVAAATDVSGTLPTANGGTNNATLGGAGTIAHSDGSKITYTAAGTAGYAFISQGTGTPTWDAPWFIEASHAGASPSLGTGNVASYTEIIDAGLTLTPISGSAAVGTACSTTNAATSPSTSATTCAAGSESLGIYFTAPYASYYKVCTQYEHLVRVNSGVEIDSEFIHIETPSNAQTVTQTGGTMIETITTGETISTGTALDNGKPVNVCTTFLLSAALHNIRLMYKQSVGGSPTSSAIVGTSGHATNITWSVNRIL